MIGRDDVDNIETDDAGDPADDEMFLFLRLDSSGKSRIKRRRSIIHSENGQCNQMI